MGKGDYKKKTSGEYAQDCIRTRKWICHSDKHISWCKRYLNRYYRHTTKNLKENE